MRQAYTATSAKMRIPKVIKAVTMPPLKKYI